MYTHHLDRARILEDAPNPDLALIKPPPTSELEVGAPLNQIADQQQAIAHHTPIDWVIWKELRISFSLIAWMRGAS